MWDLAFRGGGEQWKEEVGMKVGNTHARMTDREEGLVAGDHLLQHGDDGRALLGPGRALDAELLVWALLLVEQVGAEDGRQVQGRHLIPCDLYSGGGGKNTHTKVQPC